MSQETAASVREWTDVLARIRFGTIKIAGKNITGARIKLIAGRCANYADSDGTRVRPGIARLAVDCETDYRTAKAAIGLLRRLGLLQLVRAGARPGHADEYRLALPVDLMDSDEITYWSPARHALEIERVGEANRGKYKPKDGPDPDETCRGQETPQVDHLQGPEAPADPVATAEPAGATGTAETGPAGASSADLQGPVAPATDQGPRHKNDRPTDDDLRTAVTAPRVARPEEQISDVVETQATPSRCEHGMSRGRRPDGKAACPICRVAAARPGVNARAAQDPQGLAQVIQMRPTA